MRENRGLKSIEEAVDSWTSSDQCCQTRKTPEFCWFWLSGFLVFLCVVVLVEGTWDESSLQCCERVMLVAFSLEFNSNNINNMNISIELKRGPKLLCTLLPLWPFGGPTIGVAVVGIGSFKLSCLAPNKVVAIAAVANGLQTFCMQFLWEANLDHLVCRAAIHCFIGCC